MIVNSLSRVAWTGPEQEQYILFGMTMQGHVQQ